MSNEYVEYLLELKDGEVISAEYFGEGKQIDPLDKPIILIPAKGVPWPRELERLERLIQIALAKL